MHPIAALVVLAAVLPKTFGQIDPTTVPIDTRENWCTRQQASCPLLCLQRPGATAGTEENSCEAETLVFQCICSNGQAPNASEFSETIPYFLCTESNNQCVENCGRNDACVTSCRTSRPCGAQNPTRVNTSTISTMEATASASATGRSAAETSGGSAVYTGFGSSSTAGSVPDDSAAKALAIGVGRTYGTAIVLSVVFGGFFML